MVSQRIEEGVRAGSRWCDAGVQLRVGDVRSGDGACEEDTLQGPGGTVHLQLGHTLHRTAHHHQRRALGKGDSGYNYELLCLRFYCMR